jgi:diketogulonate reductase-like aldo/keto reductase
MAKEHTFNRRRFLGWAGALGAASVLPAGVLAASGAIRKAIPKTGETIPVIGLGTSRTFDAAGDASLLADLQRVVQTFFDMGGGMIDSSPMYGSAQEVIGQLLPGVKGKKNLFAATKVWIRGKQRGIEQMEESRRLWGIERFDLMQIHNLVDWRTHLETLTRMKADGRIRYMGVTTSHGRFHGELADLLRKHDFDFVQLTYNIGNRAVESPLLSIARDRGIAVIANRPFQRGDLFGRVRGKPLPPWAREFDCASWGQFFLKYAVSHPAITCAIPATAKVRHLRDNMAAGRGRLPDEKQRNRMEAYFRSL